jgi:hypothetical protein
MVYVLFVSIENTQKMDQCPVLHLHCVGQWGNGWDPSWRERVRAPAGHLGRGGSKGGRLGHGWGRGGTRWTTRVCCWILMRTGRRNNAPRGSESKLMPLRCISAVAPMLICILDGVTLASPLHLPCISSDGDCARLHHDPLTRPLHHRRRRWHWVSPPPTHVAEASHLHHVS